MINDLYIDKYNNYLLNEEEIKNKKLIFQSGPVSLFFKVTDLCQLDCVFCNAKQYSKNKTLNFDIIKNTIDTYGRKAINVEWIGGEPTLYPQFEKLIDYAEKYKLKQVIVTNGLSLKGIIAEKLIKYNADIIISIDSSNKDLYNKIRKKSDFDVLMSNIEQLNSLRTKYNHSGHFGINFCVFKQNYQDIPNIVEFAKENNFKHINFIEATDIDKDLLLDDNNKKEIDDLFIIVKEKADKYSIDFFNPFDDKNIEQKEDLGLYCYHPFSELGVNTEEEYGVCICRKLLLNNNSNDIWNCENIKQYREKSYANIMCADNCKTCALIDIRKNYHPQILQTIMNIKNKLDKEGMN